MLQLRIFADPTADASSLLGQLFGGVLPAAGSAAGSSIGGSLLSGLTGGGGDLWSAFVSGGSGGVGSSPAGQSGPAKFVRQAAGTALTAALGSQEALGLEARLVGPSYGGPVPVSTITPAANAAGSVVSTGAGPGGLFVATGPGGAVAGSYGGGWVGPYNQATGTYGSGGSYGFARPYFGKAAGTAVVVVPAAYAPNAPNVTFPCPSGSPAGTMIAVGLPCGVPVTSVPAAQLPTIGGLPAGVDYSRTVSSQPAMQSVGSPRLPVRQQGYASNLRVGSGGSAQGGGDGGNGGSDEGSGGGSAAGEEQQQDLLGSLLGAMTGRRHRRH